MPLRFAFSKRAASGGHARHAHDAVHALTVFFSDQGNGAKIERRDLAGALQHSEEHLFWAASAVELFDGAEEPVFLIA